MTKPAKLPRFATGAAAITEPTEQKKDDGWLNSEQPPAEYFNWLHKWTYEWCNWLNNGLDALAGLAITPTSCAPTSFSRTPEADIRHANRSERVPATAAHSLTAAFTLGTSDRPYWQASGAGQKVIFALALRGGDRLRSFTLHGNRATASNWSISVWKCAAVAGTPAQLGSTASSSFAGDEGVTVSAIDETIAVGYDYYVVFTAGGNGDRAYGGYQTVDRIA